MNEKFRFLPEWVTIFFIAVHYILFEMATFLFKDFHPFQVLASVMLFIAFSLGGGLLYCNWVRERHKQLFFALNLLFCLFLSSEIYFHSRKEILLYILWMFVILSASYTKSRQQIVILFTTAYIGSLFVLWLMPPEATKITIWEYMIFLPQVILVYFFISYKAAYYRWHSDKSENRLRLLFKYSPVGMMMLSDFNQPLRNINRQFCKILGYSKKELSVRTFADIIHPEESGLIHQTPEQIESNDNHSTSVEKRLIHKTGKVIHALVSIHLLDKKVVDKKEKRTYVIGIIQDITEMKMARQQLKLHAQKLEESNRSLQEFAYAVSHDLREPVRTINSYCQLLPKYLPAEDMRPEIPEFLNFIINGAKRMEKQIKDLLQYSRIGQGELKLAPVDTRNTLFVVCHSLKAVIEEHDAKINTGKLPVLMAEKFQMQSLFQNLISNAVKYHKPGVSPQVRISAIKKKGFWLFSVADNGIGIKPEFTDKVFAVFCRLHSQEKIAGTGIGLALCHRIVQQHGGEIWVKSEFGKGSTFYFTIPIREVKQNDAHAQNGWAPIENGIDVRVLGRERGHPLKSRQNES
ncbi:MAG: ATP-binding protein [Saprospiraceae bacterium]